MIIGCSCLQAKLTDYKSCFDCDKTLIPSSDLLHLTTIHGSRALDGALDQMPNSNELSS